MRALQLVLVATALIFGTVGTASFVCTGEGTTTYGGHTVDCVSVDGMLYDVWPVSAGVSTCAANQANSCPEGTDIWVPRSYNHAKAVWDAYSSYISFVGIYRPEDGCGSCTSYAMNSEAMEAYDGTAWTSVADTPEPWFVRSTVFSEPNGDYTANCFLHTFGWEDGVGWQFNDESCYACSTTYLCSTNVVATSPPTVSPAPTLTRYPTPSPTTWSETLPTITHPSGRTFVEAGSGSFFQCDRNCAAIGATLACADTSAVRSFLGSNGFHGWIGAWQKYECNNAWRWTSQGCNDRKFEWAWNEGQPDNYHHEGCEEGCEHDRRRAVWRREEGHNAGHDELAQQG